MRNLTTSAFHPHLPILWFLSNFHVPPLHSFRDSQQSHRVCLYFFRSIRRSEKIQNIHTAIIRSKIIYCFYFSTLHELNLHSKLFMNVALIIFDGRVYSLRMVVLFLSYWNIFVLGSFPLRNENLQNIEELCTSVKIGNARTSLNIDRKKNHHNSMISEWQILRLLVVTI